MGILNQDKQDKPGNTAIDEQIIAALTARDEAGLETARGRYGALVRNLGMNILGNRSDAEECENDVFMALWLKIPPEHPDPLISYICRIARNLALKKLAYNRAGKRCGMYDTCIDELEETLAATDGSPEASMEAAELTAEINAFLAGLPDTDRLVFVRRYWFGDSYGQIAARCGITEKNVSVKLTRLRERLRAHLAKQQLI